MTTMTEDIKLTKPWKKLIEHIQAEIPYGVITLRIVNGQPVSVVEEKREVRFDKD